MTDNRTRLVEALRAQGVRELDHFVRLASGDLSRYYVNCKRAGSDPDFDDLVGEVFTEMASEAGFAFDAVGGLATGANFVAQSISHEARVPWFYVRKEAKTHGEAPGQAIEGMELGPTNRVLLVDDVVTRGGSIMQAYDAIVDTGATVVLAVSLVDRGRETTRMFGERGIPYLAVANYEALRIPAVGDESPQPATASL